MRTAWPAVLFGALLLAFPAWFGPGLVADLGRRGEETRVEEQAQVRRASCRSFFFVITVCTIAVVERGAERALSYAVSGTVRHGRVIVLRSTADAGYLTTSIGRDYLVNRSVTFAAWMIVLLLLTAGAVRYHRFHRMRAANG